MSDQQAASSSVDVEAVKKHIAEGHGHQRYATFRCEVEMNLLAALERAQQEIAELRALCLKADSTLSLLRHRGGIRWGSPTLPTESEVDQVIGGLRRAYESGQAQRGQGR